MRLNRDKEEDIARLDLMECLVKMVEFQDSKLIIVSVSALISLGVSSVNLQFIEKVYERILSLKILINVLKFKLF